MADGENGAVRLQKYITGLLGSLYVAGGAGPDKLSKTVTPSIDVTDFFFASELSIALQNAAGLTLSDQGPSIVQPQAEIWRVFGMSATITSTAPGQNVGVSFFIQNPPLSSNLYMQPLVSPPPRIAAGTPGVNERADFGGMLPVPLITQPGTVFQAATIVACGGAGSLTLSFRVLYQKLKS